MSNPYSGIHRCSICNRVTNEEIETDVGDFVSGMSFTSDPSNPMFDICVECYEEIEDVFPEEEDNWY